jgi:hypothetical protein
VGETFDLMLTCAVLDTDRVKGRCRRVGARTLALHLVPFDIVGGERFRDIVNAPRRFFQYRYSMRVLGEEFFGKEVSLPRLQVSYRVQNSLQGGSALQGRETQYSLVPVPIRVLSLVPAGASDIRDTPVDTFGDVDARLFRSNLLLIAAGVAFVLAGLLAVMVLARAAVKRRATSEARRGPCRPGAALRACVARIECRADREPGRRMEWRACRSRGGGAPPRRRGRVVTADQPERGRSRHSAERRADRHSAFGRLGGTRTVLSSSVTPDAVALNGPLRIDPGIMARLESGASRLHGGAVQPAFTRLRFS